MVVEGRVIRGAESCPLSRPSGRFFEEFFFSMQERRTGVHR
jgi:hypothetical protein